MTTAVKILVSQGAKIHKPPCLSPPHRSDLLEISVLKEATCATYDLHKLPHLCTPSITVMIFCMCKKNLKIDKCKGSLCVLRKQTAFPGQSGKAVKLVFKFCLLAHTFVYLFLLIPHSMKPLHRVGGLSSMIPYFFQINPFPIKTRPAFDFLFNKPEQTLLFPSALPYGNGHEKMNSMN